MRASTRLSAPEKLYALENSDHRAGHQQLQLFEFHGRFAASVTAAQHPVAWAWGAIAEGY